MTKNAKIEKLRRALNELTEYCGLSYSLNDEYEAVNPFHVATSLEDRISDLEKVIWLLLDHLKLDRIEYEAKEVLEKRDE